MDKNFENIVTKVLQMAQNVAQMTQIQNALNSLKVGPERISNMLMTNMNKDFEDVVTKVLQMAHKVAHVMAQMTKNGKCVE